MTIPSNVKPARKRFRRRTRSAVTIVSQRVVEIWEQGGLAREVERQVRDAGTVHERSTSKRGRPPKQDTRPAEVRSIEQRIRKHLQTDVTITVKDTNRGSIHIEFYSADDLERVVDRMGITDNPH